MAERMDLNSKRAHLEMIQGVVNRLSTNSFLLKGWSVVLVSALFALAAKDANVSFVHLAYFPAIAFWALDGYFLWQERLYRALYDQVRHQGEESIDFSLDTSLVSNRTPGWSSAFLSTTLIVFHGAILVTILIVMFLLPSSR